MTPAAIQSAMAQAQSAPITPPQRTASLAAAKKAATDFEGVFISQFLSQMFAGVSTDGPFGGGPGEAMFRSMMLDQYGKQIAQQGGFGLSAAITRSLLIHQEASH